MKARERVLVSWSGGKDCCLMLHALLEAGEYEVAGLLCMVQDGRITMHGVPTALLESQAEALGLPLEQGAVAPGETYETAMARILGKRARDGIRRTAYGDLFLADVKAYREGLHARLGLDCLFPVWGRDTRDFARDFLASGYRAVVTCVDAARLDASLAGRPYDAAFVAGLPESVDPCGENGEFHTFVFDGPRFRRAVRFRAAAPVRRRFEAPGHAFDLGFCELAPVDGVEAGA